MFFRHFVSNVLILLVYVDDILVIGSTSSHVLAFISYLHKLVIRGLGNLNYFLGVEVVVGNLDLSNEINTNF